MCKSAVTRVRITNAFVQVSCMKKIVYFAIYCLKLEETLEYTSCERDARVVSPLQILPCSGLSTIVFLAHLHHVSKRPTGDQTNARSCGMRLTARGVIRLPFTMIIDHDYHMSGLNIM